MLDLVDPADGARNDRRILGRDLCHGAKFLRNVPAFDLDEDGDVHRGVGLRHVDGAFDLVEVALLVQREIDEAAGVAALVFPGLHAGIDEGHVIGVAIEVIGAGQQRVLPQADAAFWHQRHRESLGIVLGLAHAHHFLAAVQPGLLDVGLDDADLSRRDDGRRGLLIDADVEEILVEAV